MKVPRAEKTDVAAIKAMARGNEDKSISSLFQSTFTGCRGSDRVAEAEEDMPARLGLTERGGGWAGGGACVREGASLMTCCGGPAPDTGFASRPPVQHSRTGHHEFSSHSQSLWCKYATSSGSPLLTLAAQRDSNLLGSSHPWGTIGWRGRPDNEAGPICWVESEGCLCNRCCMVPLPGVSHR